MGNACQSDARAEGSEVVLGEQNVRKVSSFVPNIV
jgi:hypothetical protein